MRIIIHSLVKQDNEPGCNYVDYVTEREREKFQDERERSLMTRERERGKRKFESLVMKQNL